MGYYCVIAKGGHIGSNQFYKAKLFLIADSRHEAAKEARKKPRIKHDQKDAILEVIQIENKDTFLNEKKIEENKPYYRCKNKQEQNLFFSEISPEVYEETENFVYKSKKHSLRKIFNDDSDYLKMKNYRGNLDFIITA